MLQRGIEDIVGWLREVYSPVEFLQQYSEAIGGLEVVLGNGVIEGRGYDLHSVTYPLVIGRQSSGDGSIYTVLVRGIYSFTSELVAVSFSGEHPLAKDAYVVQLMARMEDGSLVRGNDLWLDIVFPGFELPSKEKYLGMQPQQQTETGKRPIAVATAVRPVLDGHQN